MKSRYFGAAAAAVLAFSQTAAQAGLLPVQNATFSRPLVSLADQASPFIQGSGWTTTGPSLLEYPPGSGFIVNVGTIVWQNPLVGAVNRVDNLITDPTVVALNPIAGEVLHPNPENFPYQGAASLGAETGNEFSQLLTSLFEPGQRYSLTVGVGHNYHPLPENIPAANASLRLALFYLDDASTRQIVTSIDIFNNPATGLSANHMLDFTTPEFVVGAGNPAGRNVGVLLTTIGPAGGFFNVSNVRVSAVPEPASIGVLMAGSMLLLRRRRTISA